MEEQKFTEKESLELISRMIQNTQRKMEKGAGTPMLIWGSATVITTIIVWLIVRTTYNSYWNFLWFLIPVFGCIGMLLRKKQSRGIRTYVDKVIRSIWLVLGITGFTLSCLSILNVMWHLPILFIIILIMGMGTVLTGLIAEFKPMLFGGIVGMLLGAVQYLVPNYDAKMLIFAAIFIIMMIIPGYILNQRAQNHV
ncbi:MAG: hypothetical protein LBH58_08205 [Tannerellaceae bacterium]|jgi:hypothetical protein|nr:hypothetical protein [Tannerellaceae bacterium]